VVTAVRRWIDACWPAAALVLFVATFRTTEPEAARESATHPCDETRGRDVVALERCLDLDPQNVELMADIGDLYAASGASARAETFYRQALAVDPHDGDVHLRLGELLLRRGNAAEARREGHAALASQPGSLAAERLIEQPLPRDAPDEASRPKGSGRRP